MTDQEKNTNTTEEEPTRVNKLPLEIGDIALRALTPAPLTPVVGAGKQMIPVSQSFIHDLFHKSPGATISSIAALFIVIVLAIVIPSIFVPQAHPHNGNCSCDS